MNLYANILGEGKPFIILHGFLGMGDNWKTIGKEFMEQGYQVHLIDQRNHGRSFHDPEFNYTLLANDIINYCHTKKLKDIILLGHSMGGKTAMFTAIKEPKLVSNLIIADISPRFYPSHHDAILTGLNALDFNTISSRSEADTELAKYVHDLSTRQFLLKNLYWKDKKNLALRLNLPVLTKIAPYIGEALPAQTVYPGKTLFLRGDKSEYITNEDDRLIKNYFPKSQLVTIPNAGHWLHAENPEAFFKAVTNFLSE